MQRVTARLYTRYTRFVFKSTSVVGTVGNRGSICEIDLIIIRYVYVTVVSLDEALKTNVISPHN